MSKSKKSPKNAKDNPPILIFVGPQGSGKGTQAKLLSDKYGFNLIEMGALLRAEAEKETKLGKKIYKIIDQGKLVPSWIPQELVKKELPKYKDESIIMDGAPRQLVEAIGHDRNIRKAGRKIAAVFYINISNKEAMKRLLKRGRHDDTPEKIKTRLAWSRDKLGKILKYFKKRKYPVVKIDGEQTVKQVYRDIVKALKKQEIL